MKKETYQERKARAEQEAMDWQLSFSDYNYSWQELAHYQSYFERLAERYGLITEFKENGIPIMVVKNDMSLEVLERK